MSPLTAKIAARQHALASQGLLRRRQALAVSPPAQPQACAGPRFVLEGKSFLNFSSNDYLGLSLEPALADALHLAAKRYGVGSGASPLVTGYSEAHQALEQHLCALTGHEAALLFCSGFSANGALMKTLFDAQDIVLADKLVHASVIDGLRDSGATLKRFLHNSTEGAGRLLARHGAAALITESVFSMDGDIAPLAELSALCRQHGSWLIVDDAHGFGVLGEQGLGANALCQEADAAGVDVQVITFGKALGCQGAAVLGSRELIDFLVSNAREYIYSTALSPANAALALAASRFALDNPQLLAGLTENIRCFTRLCREAKVPLLASATAIQPVIIGDAAKTMAVAQALRELGLWVGAIRPPTVPAGSARLRLTLSARHTRADIEFCVAALSQVLTQAAGPKP
ncbi:8-amino-7-oxononanoate synthase [Shewanella sp. AS16]|uniref:aminotransferase class I/II-fold pyridoxal phosphate-dependent enzyme n=1 Tax=Shewanella sp. AS16 TaxID=2907625 RepID=UPI001F471BDA|nr:8-amino-7-oxononanoate synthase [Shewanella sp. AS16]MCE9684834.1 8-amino-7-oxononanoate synthase [Shewanella sp. AS16]